jgi:NADH-quinone oxidoreductase subunit D
MITGLRMNNAYIRPGGVAQDLPHGAIDMDPRVVRRAAQGHPRARAALNENPISRAACRRRLPRPHRLHGAGHHRPGAALDRPAARPAQVRPYCGYETYDFDVVTRTGCDAYDRHPIRIDEMYQSLRIVEQCPTGCSAPGPGHGRRQEDRLAGPAGGRRRRQGNSLDHIREIMGTSMESLIHHFKLVTEGFRVPPGQVYAAVESPKGELGCHLVSDGGTRPYRAHFRDPSFNNLQAVAAMCEGGQVADVIVAVASIDPVMGGVDR